MRPNSIQNIGVAVNTRHCRRNEFSFGWGRCI